MAPRIKYIIFSFSLLYSLMSLPLWPHLSICLHWVWSWEQSQQVRWPLWLKVLGKGAPGPCGLVLYPECTSEGFEGVYDAWGRLTDGPVSTWRCSHISLSLVASSSPRNSFQMEWMFQVNVGTSPAWGDGAGGRSPRNNQQRLEHFTQFERKYAHCWGQ